MGSSSIAAIGRYEILGEIGRGAMGIVYKARDPHIGRIVAVKTITVLDLDPLDQKEYRARFDQEARTAGRLSHPGIVTIFDVGVDPETDTPYIVMEYVAGQSLSKVLESEKGRLPMGSALRLTEEIAEALHYAHGEGVIHRDIKPANILVTPEGHGKIADFGIARFNQSHLTLPGRVLGSPAFMSPEQLEGETADSRSDLFSLGVVLYTILTGHRPFQGNSTATVCFKLANRDPLPVSAWDLDLPLDLDDLLRKALAKDPSQRFQNGNAMAAALADFRRDHEFEAEPLADIARMIDRPPLVTQQIVIDALPSYSTFAETESAEQAADSSAGGGGLYTMVNRALAIRPPGAVADANEKKPVIGTAITPIANIENKIENKIEKKIEKTTGKKSNLAAFPPASPSTAGPQRKWIGIASGVTASILLAGAFWFAHSHKSLEASHMAVPPPVPQVSAQTTQEAEPAEPVAQTEATPAPAGHTVKSRTRAPALTARATEPAPQMPARVPTSKLRAGVSPPATQPAAPTEITVQKMELANLDVTIEHGFEEGEASISVDHHKVMNRELKGENKRRALLFKKTQGRDSATMTLLPGKHDIEVRVKSPDGNFDLSKSISRGFAPGSKGALLVKCDKRKKKLELVLQ